MKFSQITEGKTYVGPKGVSREVRAICAKTNTITYSENGKVEKMPGQDFAKWALTPHRDRSNDKPKKAERKSA